MLFLYSSFLLQTFSYFRASLAAPLPILKKRGEAAFLQLNWSVRSQGEYRCPERWLYKEIQDNIHIHAYVSRKIVHFTKFLFWGRTLKKQVLFFLLLLPQIKWYLLGGLFFWTIPLKICLHGWTPVALRDAFQWLGWRYREYQKKRKLLFPVESSRINELLLSFQHSLSTEITGPKIAHVIIERRQRQVVEKLDLEKAQYFNKCFT